MIADGMMEGIARIGLVHGMPGSSIYEEIWKISLRRERNFRGVVSRAFAKEMFSKKRVTLDGKRYKY